MRHMITIKTADLSKEIRWTLMWEGSTKRNLRQQLDFMVDDILEHPEDYNDGQVAIFIERVES